MCWCDPFSHFPRIRGFAPKNWWGGGGGQNIFAHKSFIGNYISDKIHLHTKFEAKDSRWVYEESRLESIRKNLTVCYSGLTASVVHCGYL